MISGGYYRALIDDDDIKLGSLVLVTYIEDDIVHFVQYDHGYSESIDNFMLHYKEAPDGYDIRQTELASLQCDFNAICGQQLIERQHITSATQAIALMVNQPSIIKTQIANVRAQIAMRQADLATHTAKIAALLDEQKAALQAYKTQLTKLMQTAEEAIWTVNLYLGTNEEIKQLKAGKPADILTPITVRQRTLFMDEECALNPQRGGIDFENIDEFDNWLITNNNLQQVFPEPKGIVAFRVRRNSKDYGDALLNTMCAPHNRATYLLIRNGDCLYRIHTSYKVDDTIFPTETEFLDLLTDREYNSETRQYDSKPLLPGSPRYAEIMQKVDERRRHYLRFCLLLQGLIDRTDVFKPLDGDHLNVCNPTSCFGRLEFVYDAERQLTDGRPGFYDWLQQINSQLMVGERIIGNFSHDYMLPNKLEGRLWPEHTRWPKSDMLYTLEKREDIYLVFYYNRDDGYRDYKIRAKCLLRKTDQFILAFDRVSIADCEYYLNNRVHRHEYAGMFPLLNRVIELKKAEIETEEPFKRLLIGQIMKQHQVEHATAAAVVPQLINWWKFKNKTHRALLKDDSLALRMIVSEFDHNRRNQLIRDANQDKHAVVKQKLLDSHPTAVLIAHKKDNDYVVLIPHHTDDSRWLIETVYRFNKLGMREIKTTTWTVLDMRHQRWMSLYQSERFAAWPINLRVSDLLTDDQVAVLLQSAIDHWADEHKSTKREKLAVYKPLGCALRTVNGHDQLEYYFIDKNCKISKDLFDYPDRLSVAAVNIVNGDFKSRAHLSHVCDDYVYETPPWRITPSPIYSHSRHIVRTVMENEQNLIWYNQRYQEYLNGKKAYDTAYSAHSDAVDIVEEAMIKRQENIAFKAYVDEYHSDVLWEKHLKSLKLRYKVSAQTRSLFRWAINRKIPIYNQTVEALLTHAQSLGFVFDKQHQDDDNIEISDELSVFLTESKLDELNDDN